MNPLRCQTGRVLTSLAMGSFAMALAITGHSAETNATIAVGQRFQIESKVLNETRRYFVHTPYKYRLRSDRYPVLIVLDGQNRFAHASTAVDHLASSGRIPGMIVIGVPNTYRNRDLDVPGSSSPGVTAPGAADRFLEFLATELLPHIDRTYRTQPYRVLAGHSLGGSFAIYALQNRPQLFKGIVAISPALQTNNESLVKSMASFLDSDASLQADLYLTLANESGISPSYSKFTSILTEKAPAGLRWKSVIHTNETHNSIPYRGVHEGLQQVFDGWTLTDPATLYDQSGFSGLEAHYAKLSQRFGFTVPVQGVSVENLFTQFLERGRFNDADALIQKAVTWFPDSAQVHFAGTMLYSMMKDQPRAIEHAKKILALNPGDAAALQLLQQNGVEISPFVTEPKLSHEVLKSVVGSYASVDEFIDVSMKNDRLYCTSDAGEFELKALSDTSFYLAGVGTKLTVTKNKRGKVMSVALDRVGTMYATETLTPR